MQSTLKLKKKPRNDRVSSMVENPSVIERIVDVIVIVLVLLVEIGRAHV